MKRLHRFIVNRFRAAVISSIISDPNLIEVARLEIENVLVDFRDSRISELGRGNGLVIRERNGDRSDIIRIGTPEALVIGLKAIYRLGSAAPPKLPVREMAASVSSVAAAVK